MSVRGRLSPKLSNQARYSNGRDSLFKINQGLSERIKINKQIQGKSGGSGLGNYTLDVMKLE